LFFINISLYFGMKKHNFREITEPTNAWFVFNPNYGLYVSSVKIISGPQWGKYRPRNWVYRMTTKKLLWQNSEPSIFKPKYNSDKDGITTVNCKQIFFTEDKLLNCLDEARKEKINRLNINLMRGKENLDLYKKDLENTRKEIEEAKKCNFSHLLGFEKESYISPFTQDIK